MDIKNKSKRFHGRAFVSVIAGFSFLGMVFTGAMLFVTPPGRIAHWTGWTLLGLGKEQWAAQHMWFSLVFFVSALIHLYLNWKPLLSYFKDRVQRTFSFRLEWILALVLCVVVFWGTLKEVPPFSPVMALNEHIKQSWDTTQSRPPIAHAELMTLHAIAESTKGLDVATMMQNLQAQGIEASSGDTVMGDLAQHYQTTPSRLYQIATGSPQAGRKGRGGGNHGGGQAGVAGGGGFGRMTLRQYCEQQQLDLDGVLSRLKSEGIQADADSVFRRLADDNGLHPSAIRRILEEPTSGWEGG